jgi:hypothetical protein
MRILQLHCDSIEYTPTKKEIKSAEEIEPKKVRIEEVVVCFTAVEKDDDSDVAKNAITEIQESMKKVGCDKLLLYPYANHLVYRLKVIHLQKALKFFLRIHLRIHPKKKRQQH